MKFPLQKSGIPLHQPDDDDKIQQILICLFLAVGIALVYWKVQGHEFLNYDDGIYITSNQHVQKGFNRESLTWAFTATRASNWRPVTWLSHMLDYELYGLNPKGRRLANVLFHAPNVILWKPV